jgi:hypothetical protein
MPANQDLDTRQHGPKSAADSEPQRGTVSQKPDKHLCRDRQKNNNAHEVDDVSLSRGPPHDESTHRFINICAGTSSKSMVGGHKVAGRSEDCGAVGGFCEKRAKLNVSIYSIKSCT